MSERLRQLKFVPFKDGSLWLERNGEIEIVPPKDQKPVAEADPMPKLPPAEYFQDDEPNGEITLSGWSSAKYDR